MALQRTRPSHDADERTQLVGWLDLQRSIVHRKCEGLTDEDAHRAVLPTSPLMTVAGIVAHLRWTEHCWFEALFLGNLADNPQFRSEREDADMRVEGVPLAAVLDEYAHQCARSNETVAAHDLDEQGSNHDFGGPPGSLRWMLLHMVEETARHVGHLDTIRELLDGRTGYY